MVTPAEHAMAGVYDWNHWNEKPMVIGETIPPNSPTQFMIEQTMLAPRRPPISGAIAHIGPNIDMTNAYPSDIAVTER